MTLPVPKAVADASLDTAILLVIERCPGIRRAEIECSRVVADILVRARTAKAATQWLGDRLQYLRETGAIEKRRYHQGWFRLERAA